MDVVGVLKSCPLFSSLSKGSLWRIASLVQEKKFKGGEYLCHQNEPGDFCFIVSSGKVEVFYEIKKNTKNEKLVIAQVGPGEIIGELSLIDHLPRSASLIALENTKTLIISAWDFQAQLQAYPEMALQLLPIIAQRLRRAQDQLTQLTLNDS